MALGAARTSGASVKMPIEVLTPAGWTDADLEIWGPDENKPETIGLLKGNQIGLRINIADQSIAMCVPKLSAEQPAALIIQIYGVDGVIALGRL